MIHFYLEDVLPKVTTDNPVKQDVDFLGNMLLDLRQLIKRCVSIRGFFPWPLIV